MKNQYKILAEQYNLIVNAAQKKVVETEIVVPEEIDRKKLPTDLKAFIDWIYTHSEFKDEGLFNLYKKEQGYKNLLNEFFWARCEDYNEGVGLEWDIAIDAAVKLILKLAKEYKIWLKAKETLYKDNPGINIDI